MTRKALAALSLSTASLMISGCDWIEGATHDTEMRNVEILPGTASDEMVTLDQSAGDGTAIDPSTATGPAQPKAAAEDDAAAPTDGAGEGASADAPPAADDGTNPDDVVVRPPAGGAEPDRPARPADQTKR